MTIPSFFESSTHEKGEASPDRFFGAVRQGGSGILDLLPPDSPEPA